MTVKIVPNDKGNPPGKLADAELHFADGPLEGLKLIGFAMWERQDGRTAATSRSRRAATRVNGERRSFSLLRPVADSTAQNRIRDLILAGLRGSTSATAVAWRRRSARQLRQHRQELRVLLLTLRRQRPFFAQALVELARGRRTSSCRRR